MPEGWEAYAALLPPASKEVATQPKVKAPFCNDDLANIVQEGWLLPATTYHDMPLLSHSRAFLKAQLPTKAPVVEWHFYADGTGGKAEPSVQAAWGVALFSRHADETM